ncbi:BnaC02g41430D [Brassica napus]|uniref:BnaC02g41430D protein n=1 Tax=Brassica napus TaxID=3708 RepID=A0A078I3Y2_BRANA|nr:BnaC02g41430D [Brassica napus]
MLRDSNRKNFVIYGN